MRDMAGFVETRGVMLALKPGQKGHWISFAVAHHLNGDHALAAQALKTYQGMQVGGPGNGWDSADAGRVPRRAG